MGWLGFVAKPFPTLNWLTSNRKGLSTQLNDLNENSRWREVGMTAGYAPFAPFISFPHILPHLTEAPLQERQECGASISLGAYSGTQKIESTWINPDQPGYGDGIQWIWLIYGWHMGERNYTGTFVAVCCLVHQILVSIGIWWNMNMNGLHTSALSFPNYQTSSHISHLLWSLTLKNSNLRWKRNHCILVATGLGHCFTRVNRHSDMAAVEWYEPCINRVRKD